MNKLDVISIIISSIAAIGSIVACVFYWKANKKAEDANEIAKEANEEVKKSNEISYEAKGIAEGANAISKKVSFYENIQRLHEMDLIGKISVLISYKASKNIINSEIDKIKLEHIDKRKNTSNNIEVYLDYIYIKGADYIYVSEDNISLRAYVENLYRLKADLILINEILIDTEEKDRVKKHIEYMKKNIDKYGKNKMNKLDFTNIMVERLDKEDISYINDNEIYVQTWSYSGIFDSEFEKQLKERCYKIKNTEENRKLVSILKKKQINNLAESYKKIYK